MVADSRGRTRTEVAEFEEIAGDTDGRGRGRTPFQGLQTPWICEVREPETLSLGPVMPRVQGGR
jgi:hypothetical protein